MNKKILVILTSHDEFGDTGNKTGFWFEEFAAPYYQFLDAGLDITIASPKGGKAPIDPKSLQDPSQTDDTRRALSDENCMNAISNTLPLNSIKAQDYDAIYFAGGHGPLWDLVKDQNSIQLIEDCWSQDKIVSAVCHGPIVFLYAKDTNGEPLVKNREVTGFSNDEEKTSGTDSLVPYLLESEFIARGAKYSKAGNFQEHLCVDGHLITGQNPASSKLVAQAVLKALG